VLTALVSVAIGASLGAWLRWGFGLFLNPLFPTLPLGTLVANLVGGLLMGIFMALTKDRAFFPEALKLAIATGFLGGLTTFSTFSAETVTLLLNGQFFWTSAIIVAHVVGSLLLTSIGFFIIKVLI
jgi:CrcB protein